MAFVLGKVLISLRRFKVVYRAYVSLIKRLPIPAPLYCLSSKSAASHGLKVN
jgi:hypothetical protein